MIRFVAVAVIIAGLVTSFGFVQAGEKKVEAPVAASEEVVQAAEHYTFDKAHTQVLFFVDHLGFSKSQGEFHEYDGHFIFDRTHPEKSSVEVTIKTSSIDMDHEKWNQHMTSADFLNSEAFPDMVFKSKEIVVTDDNTADIMGDLTLLGITKPVTLRTTYNLSLIHI